MVFAAFTLISALWFVIWGRKNYHGPQVTIEGMGLDMGSDETVVYTTKVKGTAEKARMTS